MSLTSGQRSVGEPVLTHGRPRSKITVIDYGSRSDRGKYFIPRYIHISINFDLALTGTDLGSKFRNWSKLDLGRGKIDRQLVY